MTVRTDLIPIVAAPMIDPAMGRVELTMPVGKTLLEIVNAAVPGLTVRDRLHVRVHLISDRGSVSVPQDHWHCVRPHAGVSVVIRILPGKDALRSIMQIVVAVAAVALGAFFGPVLAGTLGLSGAMWQGVVGLGVTVLGNLLINALIPPAKPLEQQNRFQISGMRNALDPDGAVPLILGTIRYAPPFGCYTYTEIVGDWQYLRGSVCAGYGPLAIDDIRVGDTSIAKYDEVTPEPRYGLPEEPPLSIITQQIVEEIVGAELLKPLPRDDLGEVISGQPATEEPVERTTGADASGASVILAWPAGLVRYDDEGDAKARTVSVRIDQRRVDAEGWTLVTTIDVTARKLEAFYRQHTWKFPSRGRWQVRVTMLTDETTSSKIQQRTSWAALQSLRPEYPWDFPHPLAHLAFRIKATHQLNGQLDTLNALFSRPCLDYDHVTDAWVTRTSSNPAAIYRYVLQSPANPKRMGDSDIDLDDLAEWHDYCRIKGLKYDRAIDDKTLQLRDLLTEIAAAGRASPRHNGLKWSVTIDRPDKPIVDHFNPRNSYGFEVARSYVEPPDAFRVSFLDATNDFKQAERIVPWPGKEEAEILLTEELHLPGKTDPAEIYREARRRQYEAIYRPDVYTVSRDGPAGVAVRGSRVRLSSDIISSVQSAARVKSTTGRIVELDDEVTMEAGRTYAIRFRSGVTPEDTLGTSVVRTLVTRVGTHRAVTVADVGAMPRGPRLVDGTMIDGDLVHFGESDTLDYDLIVIGVEAGEDGSSHYRLVDAAPIIDELVDALAIPAWSGRAGVEIDDEVNLPPAPRIASVRSGFAGTGVSGQIDYLIEPGSGPVITAKYVIHHRPAAGAWSTITIAAASGGGKITGYSKGQSVEIYATALNVDEEEGPATATIALVVGAADAAIPVALDATKISVAALLGGAVAQFLTSDDAATSRVQIYRSQSNILNRATDASGAPVPVDRSRSYTVPIGDTTRENLILNGNFDTNTVWSYATGWTWSSGKATKTAGTAGAVSQALAAVAGKFYRIYFTVSGITAGTVTPRLQGGTPRSGTARNANGSYVDRIQAVSGNNLFELFGDAAFAGSVSIVGVYLETATSLAQGTHYFWFEPQNDDGVPGPVSGPFTVSIK